MLRSIRWKIALGLTLPVLVALIGFSVADYYRRNVLLTEIAETSASHMGETVRGGLKHAMLQNDSAMLESSMSDFVSQEHILNIAILDADGRVKYSSNRSYFETMPTESSPGCVECHRPTGVIQKTSMMLDLPGVSEPFLRSNTIIENEPECFTCHDPSQKMLGVIITDFSLQSSKDQIKKDMWSDVLVSTFIAIIFILTLYVAAHFLIVKRVEKLKLPLTQYARGDLSARIPLNLPLVRDEIDDLINAFNQTAGALETELQSKEQASDVRYLAVKEERQRLARELHDSTAQVLAYVRNKVTAARLLIEQNKLSNAVQELRQLDEAAGNVFADLRQAILDLKTDIREDQTIDSVLTEYALNFERYSDIPTQVINKDAGEIKVPSGYDLQLLRIVQEALANIRKHSGGTKATVILEVDNDHSLVITVSDNGLGFDPTAHSAEARPHFGLEIMNERARSIGASFDVVSHTGQGTQIIVKLPRIRQGEP